MPSILIKDVPKEIHAWLKREADRNRRSMMQEALVVFEERMAGTFRPVAKMTYDRPARTRKAVSTEWVVGAIREGRDV
jgi:hypothetical protein